ncbi:MAG: sulfite exporter TauE/SafE family protein [Dehalococcoidia bacterium]|nr:sulfite exporter TauE/SafE family protein [Dehalococcoidia bacterium]
MEYVVVPLFFGISFVFSMLGMGGSQLYIPILFWMGMDFRTEAIPLGMLLNVVNTSSASFVYGRKGLINWRVALPFGLTMVVFAPLGALVNTKVPVEALIVCFALFTAAAAILMLRGRTSGHSMVGTPRRRMVFGLSGGSVLGFVAGLIGRGGGSFVVPLLYLAGIEAKAAAATSALVVTFSGLSSFTSHVLMEAEPVWRLWLLSALAVLAGSQLGSRFMASRLNPGQVRKVFGIVLLCISATLILKDVIGLW